MGGWINEPSVTSTDTPRARVRDKLTIAVPPSATAWLAGDMEISALGVAVGVGVGVLVGLGVKVGVGGVESMPIPWTAKL